METEEKQREILEKEIEIIEDSLPKLLVKSSKLDSTSSYTFFLTVIIFVISVPEASIKLAMLGIEIKVEYAIYILYLISLYAAQKFMLNKIHAFTLMQRYKWLMNERYGSVPPSVKLAFYNDHDIHKYIFTNMLKKASSILNKAMLLAFLLGYFWMTYELITLSTVSTFNTVMSIFIVILCMNLIISVLQATTLKIQNKKDSISFNKQSTINK